ncbi:MAG: ATP-binding domain-containing protein [Acidimicrobiales bacterium]
MVFDLIDGSHVEGYQDRQDEAATTLQSRLLTHRELVSRRQLLIPIYAITYAPALPDRSLPASTGYPVANSDRLAGAIESYDWSNADERLFELTLSALQSISTIRRSRGTRNVQHEDSRGAKLQHLEDSIATLDNLQSKAVIETVEGVQRIRGLAGSGKTIVLALKAAYLHSQHPEWRIAVTFFTRSLKEYFTRLINTFVIEQTGEEPNWEVMRVLSAWGAPGATSRDGIYHEFCKANGADYLDFRSAQATYGRDASFEGACALALSQVDDPVSLYDAILIDEAQDLPTSFMRLCYDSVDQHKRLVYAYDELQNLSGTSVPSPEEMFGRTEDGSPLVTFDQPESAASARRDIILEKCYRNSGPVLVTAHALGFGIYHEPLSNKSSGLIQMFDQPALWTEIGYRVKQGDLVPQHAVVLERTPETSPEFLEAHSSTDDLVQFKTFDSEADQSAWVADAIASNLFEDDLRYDDIIIINTDPVTARKRLGSVRAVLHSRNIMTHLAGVDTSADVFFRPEEDSITCTGIYRAKGNEAGMVYVINAQECQTDFGNLARLRNRLFTAITRSKCWVRVLGVGPAMATLESEYKRIRDANFELRFTYPTERELNQLQVVHRDMSAAEKKAVTSRQQSLIELVEDLEAGRLYAEDLNPDVLERLKGILDTGDI